jgi:HSP20 family protein
MAYLMNRQPNEVMSLRDAMDRLFDESFLRAGAAGAQALGPAIDLAETDKEILVTAAVPGLKPDDLKISLTGSTLEISAQTSTENERKDATYHLRERHVSSFRRALALPKEVVADKAKAEFENGVVTLTLPKVESQQRKSITIKPKVNRN